MIAKCVFTLPLNYTGHSCGPYLAYVMFPPCQNKSTRAEYVGLCTYRKYYVDLYCYHMYTRMCVCARRTEAQSLVRAEREVTMSMRTTLQLNATPISHTSVKSRFLSPQWSQIDLRFRDAT
jgi:hypothetical protein